MPNPRARQRFPNGGKTLHELLRMDYEPHWIDLRAANDVWDPLKFPDVKRRRVRSAQEILHDQETNPGTVFLLTYEPLFDPMLYFWPVMGQHVIHFRSRPMPAEDLRRLVKALLRDQAQFVQVSWPIPSAHPFGDATYATQSFGPIVGKDSAL